MDDLLRLDVASSGLWLGHVCPVGKTVLHESRNDGRTWDADWILRADGPDGDLGYPSTVELGDGSLLTVFYQRPAGRRGGRGGRVGWHRW